MRFDAYIVTGSRDWTARAVLERVLTDACPGLIIQGGARGADMMALEWARANRVDYVTFSARWSELGKRAGIERNIRMLDAYPEATVIAFPLGGPGTRHCMAEAKKRGMPLRVYDTEGRLV